MTSDGTNRLSAYADEIADRRRQTTRDVGDYRLSLHHRYMLWQAERLDGKPVPQGLRGYWTEVEDFEAARNRIAGGDANV